MKDQNRAIWRVVLMAILGKTSVAVPERVVERVMDLITEMTDSESDISDEFILKLQKDVDDLLREYGLIKGVDADV